MKLPMDPACGFVGSCQREYAWTIDLHTCHQVHAGGCCRVAMIHESCSILSSAAVLPVGAMRIILASSLYSQLCHHLPARAASRFSHRMRHAASQQCESIRVPSRDHSLLGASHFHSIQQQLWIELHLLVRSCVSLPLPRLFLNQLFSISRWENEKGNLVGQLDFSNIYIQTCDFIETC
ncbi:hypothetical protein PAHAL_3G504900 [Panicum hallii]|jgi:hypothetical protein|uniref:Uncharacterized protein n=1 Tax=Panicum hallii TaxID=206008 RepID=A0A2T8KM32_9POAL|nr:hypothetical protein PAHAL_3G504900 [Panicum hallii]